MHSNHNLIDSRLTEEIRSDLVQSCKDRIYKITNKRVHTFMEYYSNYKCCDVFAISYEDGSTDFIERPRQYSIIKDNPEENKVAVDKYLKDKYFKYLPRMDRIMREKYDF